MVVLDIYLYAHLCLVIEIHYSKLKNNNKSNNKIELNFMDPHILTIGFLSCRRILPIATKMQMYGSDAGQPARSLYTKEPFVIVSYVLSNLVIIR